MGEGPAAQLPDSALALILLSPLAAGPPLRAARILEALWAAGYRPAVYRQARLPRFLHPARQRARAR